MKKFTLCKNSAFKFISIEGGDGSGKTTQAALLVRELMNDTNREVLLTKQPSNLSLFDKNLRQLILDPVHKICPTAELLLYLAARQQHISEILNPLFERGGLAVSDRWSDSTYAYQVKGRCLPETMYLNIESSLKTVKPDITFWLDIPPEEALQRVALRGSKDRIDAESLEFHCNVWKGYSKMHSLCPERIIRINADQTELKVFETICSYL